MENILQGIGPVIITLVMISALLSAHELGHFIAAKRAGMKVDEFAFGFPPRIWGIRRGETEYTINLIPFTCFVKLGGEDDPSVENSFAAAKKRWRATVLLAGPLVNILLAVLLFAGAYMVGWPTATESQIEVAQVTAQSPAEQAGFKEGDIILSIAGQSISSPSDLKNQITAHVDEPVEFLIQRGEEQLSLSVTPRKSASSDQVVIGIAMQGRALKIERVSYGPITALGLGAQQTWNTLYLTVNLPVMLIKGQIPSEIAGSLRPSGIVGIFQMTNQAATATVDSGWGFPLLYMLGTLSAGLGLANLLPIPGLDGGRLLFLLVEAIRRKRINPEREAVIHFAGLMLLFGLMAVLVYMDVLYPLAPINWNP